MAEIHIIGLGGTGGWFLPNFTKCLSRNDLVHLWDDDKVEAKNLIRQNFTLADLNQPKVSAILRKLPRDPNSPAYQPHVEKLAEGITGDLAFCFADNHGARKQIIQAVYDKAFKAAIVTGNEFASAEAYLVMPDYKDTPFDPFRKYPEIVAGNIARKSCASAPPEEQSLVANAVAAVAAITLWEYWFGKLRFPDAEMQEKFAPRHIDWGGTKFRTYNGTSYNVASSEAAS